MNKQAPLFACLHIREFPAQAMLRLRPELRNKPCIVLDGEPPLQQLCSLNSAARSLGLVYGMTRVEVETFPGITILVRSRREEDAARSALLECAAFFSPRIEDQSTDHTCLCILDITGTEKLFGTPSQLGRMLLNRLRALHLQAFLVIGGNVPALVALVRGASNRLTVIPRGEESTYLAPLPLSVLDLSTAHAERFALWGIHTLGMLAALPEESLIARVGQQGKRLRQLARGEATHFFRPIEQQFSLIEHMELDTPVDLLDSLLFVLGIMLHQLILRASSRIFALASVTTTLSLENGAQHTCTVRSALPSNLKHLWLKLIQLDLEAHTPTAAIRALTLSAEHGVTNEIQMGLFSPPLPEPARLDIVLARIRAIVGEENVGCAQLNDTHRNSPADDSFQLIPFCIPANMPASELQGRAVNSIRVIRPPSRITVFLEDRKPAAFIFEDKHYSIEQAYGPWLSSGEWWGLESWNHGQWDLMARTTDGTTLCCCVAFRSLQDRHFTVWSMLALYD